MVHISPDQHLFSLIRKACDDTGIAVYSALPDANAGYPFAYVAEQFNNQLSKNKDNRHYTINQTVHVYHNDVRKRGTLDGHMTDIYNQILQIKRAGGRQTTLTDFSKQIINDTSTDSTLLHGVIEVTFEIN